MRGLVLAMSALLATGATAAYAQPAPIAGQSMSGQPMAGQPMSGQSMSGQAMSGGQGDTTAYVTAAGQSDEFEVQEGKMAESMGHSAKVRAFGRQMVKDHTKSTQMVMAAAQASGMPSMAPPPLTADQQQMISQLQGTSGKDFDRTYVQQQMQSHQQALAVQQGYAQNGSDPNLKMAAGKIVPVVERHIQMLQSLQSGM